MKVPSIQYLKRRLNLTHDQAELIRAIGLATSPLHRNELLALINNFVPATTKYIEATQSQHHRHWENWLLAIALHAMKEIIGGDSIECLGPPHGSDFAPPYEYINNGGPYNTTLIYDRKADTLKIGTWGSIAERHPNW
jgi:hypothetical protein